MNGGYTPYQLNKCEPVDHYYKDYKTIWNEDRSDYIQKPTGKYNKFVGKSRVLILNEVDRLEYLISYCLKNYYIKHANFVANGDYVAKWKYESDLEHAKKVNTFDKYDCGHYERIRDLENKLDTIQRISKYE